MEKFTMADIKDFKEGKIAVNCPTEELRKELLQFFGYKGYYWKKKGDALLFKPSLVLDWWDDVKNVVILLNYGNEHGFSWNKIEHSDVPVKQFHGWEQNKSCKCGGNGGYLHCDLCKGEQEQEEKTYTTGQMIDMLMDNHERIATMYEGGITHRIRYNPESERFEVIGESRDFEYHNLKDRWTIIEPPPKPVPFSKAFKA